jgi:hypothetical protein
MVAIGIRYLLFVKLNTVVKLSKEHQLIIRERERDISYREWIY